MEKEGQRSRSSRLRRFPRLHLDRDMVLASKLLRITYNNLARERVHWDGYDVFNTRMGIMAPHKFALMGKVLVEKHIDPSLYIKILCKHGVYSRSSYLPQVTWLGSHEALRSYGLILERERKKYPVPTDFKKSLGSKRNEILIMESVKRSAQMVKETRHLFGLKIVEAVVFLKAEVSPWYWSWFISSINKELAEEILDWLVHDEPDLKKKIMLCTKFYVLHTRIWKEAKQLIRKYI